MKEVLQSCWQSQTGATMLLTKPDRCYKVVGYVKQAVQSCWLNQSGVARFLTNSWTVGDWYHHDANATVADRAMMQVQQLLAMMQVQQLLAMMQVQQSCWRSHDASATELLTEPWCKCNRVAGHDTSTTELLTEPWCKCNRIAGHDTSAAELLTEPWCKCNRVADGAMMRVQQSCWRSHDASATELLTEPCTARTYVCCVSWDCPPFCTLWQLSVMHGLSYRPTVSTACGL